jgi:hypothetical protein
MTQHLLHVTLPLIAVSLLLQLPVEKNMHGTHAQSPFNESLASAMKGISIFCCERQDRKLGCLQA